MDLKQLLKTTPESLAKTQLDALKADTINTLNKMINLIQLGDYEQALEMILYSGSGDGYGEENYYIEFHLGDIWDTLIKLQELQMQSVKVKSPSSI